MAYESERNRHPGQEELGDVSPLAFAVFEYCCDLQVQRPRVARDSISLFELLELAERQPVESNLS